MTIPGSANGVVDGGALQRWVQECGAALGDATDLEATTALVIRVLALCETIARGIETPFDTFDVDMMFAEEHPRVSVPNNGQSGVHEDLAAAVFAARVDLRPVLARLEDSEPPSDECARARRRVAKALSSLDAALSNLTGDRSALPTQATLRESLATRRHYARLRRAILTETSAGSGTRRGLERLRLQIALLEGNSVYEQLRPNDRAQLDDLANRVREVLAGATDPDASHRLWQDLVGFAHLTTGINHRQDLVENDTAVVIDAYDILTTGTTIPPRLRARLDSLEGIDDEVDRLLDGNEWEPSRWRLVVMRLHRRLAAPVTGRFRILRGTELNDGSRKGSTGE